MAVDLPAHIARKTRQVVGLAVDIHLQGQGKATELLREICAEADREGFMLMLEPKPTNSTFTVSQAESWYGRFGFVTIQETPIRLMVREVSHGRTH
jgi:N-acetylglutamate synthase-like GNAT family acetyltransferase